MPVMMKYEKGSVYVGDRFRYGSHTMEVSHVLDRHRPVSHTVIVFLRVGTDGKLTGAPYFIPFDELEAQGFIGPIDAEYIERIRQGVQRILREGHE